MQYAKQDGDLCAHCDPEYATMRQKLEPEDKNDGK